MRKFYYFGYITRKQSPCLEKEIMQEMIPGKRKRGRTRTTWTDVVHWLASSIEKVTRHVNQRTYSHWKRLVDDAANPRIEYDWRQGRAWQVAADFT